MTVETLRFKASELCSRKLWQMVNTETELGFSASQLEEAVAELAARRHYLTELQEMGKLGVDLPEA
jgi:hypothetical protein